MLCSWSVGKLQIGRNLCTLGNCLRLQGIAKKINLYREAEHRIDDGRNQRDTISL